MTLSVAIKAWVSAQFASTSGQLVTSAQLAERSPVSYGSGSGSGKVSKMHASTRTLAASASESLDLAGGTLTDPTGAVLTFTKVKVIHVRPSGSNAAALVVGGAASNAFVGPFGAAAHTIAVPAGGILLLVDPGTGWTVTAGTGDILKVLNGSGSAGATYDIEIFGE